jgi:hypothetical protein
MQQDATLSWPTRSMIVLIALLQGLMLFAAQELADQWPFRDIGWRYCWYAWVLTVPTAVALTLIDLKAWRLWLHAGLASLLVLALAAWAAWNLSGETALYAAGLQVPLSVCLAVATFIALPWWQFRLHAGHWRADYGALFERAWQNGLTLVLAAVFTGLTWLLLWLWAALFRMVKVDFFHELFGSDAFIALATGMLAGFGVLIGRTQHRAMQITRQVLFAICRGLLPLLSFIAVLFVLSLPLTGLAPLWATRSAASLLLVLAVLLISLANAVYQHDDGTPPYPAWLRRLVEASLLALPIYAGLALYAMTLRVSQYGWTLSRFWGFAVAVLIAGYAIGYAFAALRRQGRWLHRLEPVNRWMCWTVLATALLAISPVIDPVRITLASQMKRLRADPALMTADAANQLRFELGRRGVQALRTLQKAPSLAADTRASSIIVQALARQKRESRWDNDIDDGVRDLAGLKARIVLAKGTASPADDWWQAVLDRRLSAGDCLDDDKTGDKRCVALRRDLDGDGEDEVLLCMTTLYSGPRCQLHVREPAGWRKEGDVSFQDVDQRTSNEAPQALRDGRLTVQPPRWPTLLLDGAAGQLEIDRSKDRAEAATP